MLDVACTGCASSLYQTLAAHAGFARLRRLDEGPENSTADLGSEAVAEAILGCDLLLHMEPWLLAQGEAGAETVLEQLPRRTFALLNGAVAAGTPRVVLLSHLNLYAGYEADLRVREDWAPRPQLSPAGLAAHIAELITREFVRAERITAIALRLGSPDESTAGTTPSDALTAIQAATWMNTGLQDRRWWAFNICSGDRFPSELAAAEPLCWTSGKPA